MRLLPLILMMPLFWACNQPDNPLIGSWKPKRYVMESGEAKDVDGHIFFSEDQWSVVFFVLDEAGNPINASAEGGTYELKNDNLTFFHKYNFSDIDKGNAGGLNRTLRSSSSEMPKEHCNIEFEEDILVIYFPSGNAMIFSQI